MTELLLLCRPNGEGPISFIYECSYRPGWLGLDVAIGLVWSGAGPTSVPTVFVLANFRPSFGTCDGLGRSDPVVFIWRQWSVRVGPDSTHGDPHKRLLVDVVPSLSFRNMLRWTHTGYKMCWTGRRVGGNLFGWDRNESIKSNTASGLNPIAMSCHSLTSQHISFIFLSLISIHHQTHTKINHHVGTPSKQEQSKNKVKSGNPIEPSSGQGTNKDGQHNSSIILETVHS